MENKKYLSEEELRQLDAKEVKAWEIPKDAVYVGQVWLPYGNRDYYKLPDGSYVCNYYSIGD